jgi:hypothetical protein
MQLRSLFYEALNMFLVHLLLSAMRVACIAVLAGDCCQHGYRGVPPGLDQVSGIAAQPQLLLQNCDLVLMQHL